MRFTELPTSCFLVDENRLVQNLAVLRDVADRTGAKILLAQKAFSMFSAYPLLREYLAGTTASGLFEARLGRGNSAAKRTSTPPPTRRANFRSFCSTPTILCSTPSTSGRLTAI